jgi:type IV pilus assembly protein PilW
MRARANYRGFTLIELMISLMLGLVVVAGVVSILMANRRSYDTNEGLSQVQESARTAFELIARDVRQAGGNGCDNSRGTTNLLNTSTAWWREWVGMRGYDEAETDPAVATGTDVGERVADTDSLVTQGLDGVALPVELHDPASARIDINAATTPFQAGDILLVCDFDHATIFQASSYNAGTPSVFHAEDVTTPGPGNCSQGLGIPTNCATTAGEVYVFQPNSMVGRVAAVTWYIGNNGRPTDSGTSLYRTRLAPGGVAVTEEMVAGVTDLNIRYGVNENPGVFDASELSTAQWEEVNSVFVTLTATSADARVTTSAENTGRLSRTFTYLITLRNRVP